MTMDTTTRWELRKTSDKAYERMRTRTAKEQLAAALEALKGPDEIPDPDDQSISRQGYWPGSEQCFR